MIDTKLIAQFVALEEGWDSYGAAPITEAALKALEALHVSPVCDGGVQIEIFANGWETEIRFGPNGRPVAFVSEESTAAPEASS